MVEADLEEIDCLPGPPPSSPRASRKILVVSGANHTLPFQNKCLEIVYDALKRRMVFQ